MSSGIEAAAGRSSQVRSPAGPDSSCPASDREAAHDFLERIKVVVVGHVDHGKSTLIGRLFYDTGAFPEGKYEALQAAAQRRGAPFEWANLVDGLQAERDQNITIETAQIWLRTGEREYVLIDAPGHQEFLKNMMTGAAKAEAALVLIDAQEGVRENSRRHGYLLALLGVRQIIVVINKMDLVGYDRERFERLREEYAGFLKSLGLEAMRFVPVAARPGENVAAPSAKLAWWKGGTVVEALEKFKPVCRPWQQPLRFAVQDVYRFDERRIVAGRIESGTIRVGDELLFTPGNKRSQVRTIENWPEPGRAEARAGESIGITLSEPVFIERGAVASLKQDPPYELSRFKGRVFWLGKKRLETGRGYRLKLATQQMECEVAAIERVIDCSSLGRMVREANPAFLDRYEVGEVVIRTRRPIAFDAADEILPLGRFVLLDGFEIAGGGIILGDNYPRRNPDMPHKSENIFWNKGKVTTDQRALQNGHPGCIVWLTGLSGSGKSTIATELERELFNRGRHAYVLDGDNMRHGLCSDLAFSPEDRKENIRRAGEVARLMADAGIICITAFISPYLSDRDLARRIAPAGKFLEVYLNAPVEVCEKRDPKGLYARARKGEIKEFTGVSAPYEAPRQPELELRTDKLTVSECVTRILAVLNTL